MNKELELLAAEFALAMKFANLQYVSENRTFTPRMIDIWGRYCLLAGKYGE